LGAAAARRVRANEAAFIRKDGWLQGADERGWLSRLLSLPAPRSPTADRPPGRPGSELLLLSLGWAKLVRGWRSTMMQVALSRPPSMFWQPWVQCPGETRFSLLFVKFWEIFWFRVENNFGWLFVFSVILYVYTFSL
jgi:hypothetical protein